MKTIRILFVSLAFPPKEDAESFQTAKIFKYLSAQPETEIFVVTSRESKSIWTAFYPKIHMGNGQLEFDLYSNRYLNHAIRSRGWFARLGSRPDIYAHALRSTKAILAKLPWKPDVVLSRSCPVTSHILAQRLAEALQVPWVMHLSDPWSINPLHPDGYDRDWNAQKEEAAFQRAEMVTCTSTRTLDRYAKHYPAMARKFRYLPNTFDPEDRRANPWVRQSRMRLAYAGSFYGTRTPETLCAAFEAFLQENPDAVGEVEIVIAGHADRSVEKFMRTKTDFLNYVGELSLKDSILLLRKADVLVLIDNKNLSNETGENTSAYEFFPSKTLDYMIAQRPVLAITDAGSISSEVIEDLRMGQSFSHDEVNSIAAAIESYWRDWRAGRHSTFEIDAISAVYNAEIAAIRLRGDIQELLKESEDCAGYR